MKPKYRDPNNPNRLVTLAIEIAADTKDELTIVEFLQTLMDTYGDEGIREKYGMDAMNILKKITKDNNLSSFVFRHGRRRGFLQVLYRKAAKEILDSGDSPLLNGAESTENCILW
jgi:hypothetical protein